MDTYIALDPTSKSLSAKRVPIENANEPERYDQLGILDANYHGCAELLMRRCSRNWFSMDVFALDRYLEMPLLPYCLHLFCDVWALHRSVDGEPPLIPDVLQLIRLARTISEKYSYTNYYHTILHGMDVAHSFSCLLQAAKKGRRLVLERHEYFVALLAALMHDIDHPGVTYDYFYDKDIENFFKSKNLASNESPLTDEASLTSYIHRQQMNVGSKRYLHSLECHQASMAVSALLGSGLIDHQPEQLQRQLCRLMADLIESTDMNLHRSVSIEMDRLVGLFDDAPPEQHMLQPEDKKLLLCFMLKCSDTSNPAKSWDYYFTWSRLITAEFFAQGDKERYIRGCLNANKFVTHFCDRNLVNFELSQIGFIKFIKESFQQLDDILRCRLTRRIIIQLETNLRQMLIIRDVRGVRWNLQSNSSMRLRVTLMVRGPRDSQPPATKLKCCLMLHNRVDGLSASRSVRSSMLVDEVQHII